ncbi:ParA family protein [Deinococcus radiophilus]|uniref:ParA family protein n=1 Tax=Deinococcus radiophilus TaxID=32062 RepID=UPI00361D7699
MPKVIAITSEKGGVGKSTLAIHLAGALTERGLDVALIDEDGRVGSSLRWQARGPGLPFPVLDPEEVKPKKLARLDAVIVDTEGRPKRKELTELAQRSDLVLVPSGMSPLELEATHELMSFLGGWPEASRRSMVVLTRVPPSVMPLKRPARICANWAFGWPIPLCVIMRPTRRPLIWACCAAMCAMTALTWPGPTCWRCRARCCDEPL